MLDFPGRMIISEGDEGLISRAVMDMRSTTASAQLIKARALTGFGLGSDESLMFR